jgi:hypothetical protein
MSQVLEARWGQLEQLADLVDQFRGDKWKADYVDRLARHTVYQEEAGVYRNFPRELKRQDATTQTDTIMVDENGKPWDHLRPSGGSRYSTYSRTPPDPNAPNVIRDLEDYVNHNGGSYALVQDWAGQQGSSSWGGAPRAVKRWIVDQREVDDSAYSWGEHAGSDHDKVKNAYSAFLRGISKTGGAGSGAETMSETFAAQHAFTYQLLRRVEHPYKNYGINGEYVPNSTQILRTESSYYVAREGLAKGQTGVYLRRGPMESASFTKKAVNDAVFVHSVPWTRILGTYWQSRSGRFLQDMYLGDNENEFLVMFEGIKADYRLRKSGEFGYLGKDKL